MLQNEPENQQSAVPAAQIRVPAPELTAAINALESSKEQAARDLAGTVAIGEVIQELHLSATPEEIWAQVQWQREKNAAMQAKPTAAQSGPGTTATTTGKFVGRRLVRGWREYKGWLWVLFWCTGGLGLFSAVQHPSHLPNSNAGIQVTGDLITGNYTVHGTGPAADAEVHGDGDHITLRGNCRTLTVNGDGNTVTVIGSVSRVIADGDENTVHWTRETSATQISNTGDANHLGLNGP